MLLKDGIAIVTGASVGLGRALSIEIAGRGTTVFGIGRSLADLHGTKERVQRGEFIPCVADVSDNGDVAKTFQKLDQLDKPVTILINNAAIYERFDFLEKLPSDFMRSLAINLGGMVNCSHAAINRMAQSGFGRVVNVTTFADLSPQPSSGAYSVSKGAARIFTRALVADLADRFPGIVITDWVPGALQTRMGIPDGISPDVSAVWGANLALTHDPTLNGLLFDRDMEVLPSQSLKRRLKNILLMQPRRAPRRLNASGVAA